MLLKQQKLVWMQIFAANAVAVLTAMIAAKARNANVECKKVPLFAAVASSQKQASSTARLAVTKKEPSLVVLNQTPNVQNAVWPMARQFAAK